MERKGWKGDISDGGASCTGSGERHVEVTHFRSLQLRPPCYRKKKSQSIIKNNRKYIIVNINFIFKHNNLNIIVNYYF